ncbi:MAG: hypothetical protein ABEJ02_04810 [Candidatus Paceibacteria bacterium]
MIKEASKTWKKVFGNWKYVILTLVVAFIFYALNGLMLNVNNLGSSGGLGFFGSIIFFKTLFLGFSSQVKLHTFISIIAISLLIGALFSLITYKVKSTKKESKNWGFLPSIGTFVAAFAPGCAACGVGLVAILGFSGAAINFLPLNGLEFSLVSILILGTAIFKISYDLEKPPACKVDFAKKSSKNKMSKKKNV